MTSPSVGRLGGTLRAVLLPMLLVAGSAAGPVIAAPVATPAAAPPAIGAAPPVGAPPPIVPPAPVGPPRAVAAPEPVGAPPPVEPGRPPVAAVDTSPAAIVPAADLHEQVLDVPVTVRDLDGREATRSIPVTLFRPDGAGPFPLAVISHGRPPDDRRRQMPRQRFEAAARYLAGKGFAVAVPTRVGYGEGNDDFDPERAGGCGVMRLEPALVAASDQVIAVVKALGTRPEIDTSRWLAVGQSVGGVATVAVAWRKPTGLVAAINFSGGHGGNPLTRPGRPCRPDQTERLWREKAAGGAVPMLWLYWENDLYWGPDHPRRWAQAWTDGGGRIEFRTMAAAGLDGHGGFGRDMDHWVPLVEDFLARQGWPRPGTVPRPPASGFASLQDVDKVPVSPGVRNGAYARFLAAASPRAFAIGPGGAAGWATGDWAPGRALGFCQARRGAACRLYAVDHEVVWQAQGQAATP